MSAPELLPCPFCGGEARTENTATDASVRCPTCKFSVAREHYTGTTVGWDATPRVIAAWNRRAPITPPTATEARIARLRADHAAVCEAMNGGYWVGTEAEAVARLEQIKAEIADLEGVK